ncbi:MAG: mechanosensitive ion channel family protein [Marmoricola sp.]
MSSAVFSSLWDIPATCQRSDSMSCAAVWNWTHNDYLAHAAAWVIGRPLSILLLVLFAWILRWLAHRVINRFIVKAAAGTLSLRWPSLGQPPHPTAQQTTRRQQRAQSLGSLLRSISSVLIFGVVFVMILSKLGADIAPILASASVVGLAIGFGAQSLVKDFLSGIAMMVEDQYGVGDSIKVDGVSGTVEAIGLRVTRLRDVDGTVWYVRIGDIVQVGNQSQNWARTVLDVTLGYDTDLAQAQRVLGEVLTSLAEHPELGPLILEEPEVWGVQALAPGGISIRVALKTAPLQQWRVARALRERVKDALDAAGIEMVFAPGSGAAPTGLRS